MREQTVKEHLINVAQLTSNYMSVINCPSLGYLAGILHDAGKYTAAFDQYISEVVDSEQNQHIKKLNHSAAGAILLNEIIGSSVKGMEAIVLQMVCEVIFSHHSGLLDNYSPNGEEGYTKRFYPSGDIYYEEVKSNFTEHIYTQIKIKKLFDEAVNEVQEQKNIIFQNVNNAVHQYYHIGILVKFLFSCLVDADWYDTECFMEDKPIEEVQSQKEIWKQLKERLEKGLQSLASDTELGQLRREISDGCMDASQYPSGSYLLKCPTGSGKTFSSLRFALHHAHKYNKKKIFYIIPYTSIIDQNAKAIKEILGNDEFAEENVYELHASLIEEPKGNNESQEYTDSKRRLSERLDTPIILTTMVRFLNTFFSGKRKYERALHQFSDAVIIFDEVQTIPVKTINMFNGAVNFLTNLCNTTCVLCTATQPLLHEPLISPSENMNKEFQIESVQLAPNKELFAISEQLALKFERVTLCDARKPNGYSPKELAEFTMDRGEAENNVMVVMNTKKSALKLFNEVKKQNDLLDESQRFQLYFLSTWLCAFHRKAVIKKLEKLKRDERVILISTQLIEAGVDLDFNCVIRSLAGLDSIIQAAGRCNRHGQNGLKNAYIVNVDFETIRSLRDIKIGQDSCEQVLNNYKQQPEYFQSNRMGEKAIDHYFQIYRNRQMEMMNYPVAKNNEKNQKAYGQSIYEYLSFNTEAYKSYCTKTKKKVLWITQAFKSAGEAFEAIESNGISVIVPFKRGADIISGLISESVSFEEKKKLLKEAQQYSITLTRAEIKVHRDIIICYERKGISVLCEQYYDEKLGFTGEIAGYNQSTVLNNI